MAKSIYRDRPGQTGTDRDRPGQTGMDRDRPGQSEMDRDRPGQTGWTGWTGTDRMDRDGPDGPDGPGQTGTDRDRPGWTGMDRDRPGQTGTDRDRPGQTGTDRDGPGRTGTDRDRPEQTGTDWDGPGQTGTDWDRPGRTGMDRDRPGRTGTIPDLRHPIEVCHFTTVTVSSFAFRRIRDILHVTVGPFVGAEIPTTMNGSVLISQGLTSHPNLSTGFANSSRFNSTVEPVTWTFLPIFSLTVSVAGFLLNTTVMVVFIRDRSLHGAFTVNIFHLLGLNITATLVQYPLAALATLYRGHWHFDVRLCDLYLLSLCMLSAATLNTHGLIAVNRAWAIISPVSFRVGQSRLRSLAICFGLWVYLFLVEFPFWLLDILLFRSREMTEEMTCNFNIAADPVYSSLTNILVYTVPVMMVWASFVVASTYRATRRVKARKSILPLPNVLGMVPLSRQKTTDGNIIAKPPNDSVSVREVDGRSNPPCQRYFILALLTTSATVCYGPRIAFFVVKHAIPGRWIPSYLLVANSLAACQTVVDPILFALTLPKVQRALRCNPGLWRYTE
ncbi:hypothetical protein BV898_10514 [Hypsibius exemplaris]|uniref:G-protein coupled receptors family 1 profile domain-containing protein n=1 Tax=Hypsibius exemplaris TaxID=2072580 RepID=A0A1W0WJF0_HYPEX|nr:hypothetical protein BV898_10514 [Hypsibius exemplaris]